MKVRGRSDRADLLERLEKYYHCDTDSQEIRGALAVDSHRTFTTLTIGSLNRIL